jgi:hypothetical protein
MEYCTSLKEYVLYSHYSICTNLTKENTLQQMLGSLEPVSINPAVLPLLPGELKHYEHQYSAMKDQNCTLIRRQLYKEQLGTYRVTLYDCLFEGLTYRSRQMYQIPETDIKPITSADVTSHNRHSHPDWFQAKLTAKRLLRTLENSAVSNRIKISSEIREDINLLSKKLQNYNQLVQNCSMDAQKQLVNLLYSEINQCDYSERWCKSFLNLKSEILQLCDSIDKQEIVRDQTTSCLTSVDPFLENIIDNSAEDFQVLDEKPTQTLPTAYSATRYYQNELEEEFRTTMFPEIGNWETIADFGKARSIDQNYKKSNQITLEEAAFLANEERPTLFKNFNVPKPKREMFVQCEILVASGNWTLDRPENQYVKLEHPITNTTNRLSHVNQDGIGWMNLDDFIAPGINTGFLGEGERDVPSYEWIENSFKYYPGETLDYNQEVYKQDKIQRANLWNITSSDQSLSDRKVRESIPLWNLEFLFLSGKNLKKEILTNRP